MWHVAEREEESEKGCRMRRTRIGGCVAVMFTCMPLDEREGGGGGAGGQVKAGRETLEGLKGGRESLDACKNHLEQ